MRLYIRGFRATRILNVALTNKIKFLVVQHVTFGFWNSSKNSDKTFIQYRKLNSNIILTHTIPYYTILYKMTTFLQDATTPTTIATTTTTTTTTATTIATATTSTNNTINPTNAIDDNKKQIIELYYSNVKDKPISSNGQNEKHCGWEGHWLEKQMGIKPNSKNEADLLGYEMKKSSKKTSLGDFSASEYAWSKINKRNSINTHNGWTDENKLTRSEYIKTFGNSNSNKENRYSWSGSCVPKYGEWNSNGQILTVNENNDIVAIYSFSKDTRSVKTNFPLFLQNDNIIIALWKSSKMKPHIDNKFGKKGFFMCEKVGNTYQKIRFGRAFEFEYFIESIKNKKIIFDSGMCDGNSRNHSQFRGSSSLFWNELITEEY